MRTSKQPRTTVSLSEFMRSPTSTRVHENVSFARVVSSSNTRQVTQEELDMERAINASMETYDAEKKKEVARYNALSNPWVEVTRGRPK